MSNYTKGPWEVTETLARIAITVKHDSIGIAPYVVCHVWPHIAKGDPKANARLIASAPELLEACKSFMAYNKDCSELSFSEKVIALAEVIEITRQAIAKAEGK